MLKNLEILKREPTSHFRLWISFKSGEQMNEKPYKLHTFVHKWERKLSKKIKKHQNPQLAQELSKLATVSDKILEKVVDLQAQVEEMKEKIEELQQEVKDLKDMAKITVAERKGYQPFRSKKIAELPNDINQLIQKAVQNVFRRFPKT